MDIDNSVVIVVSGGVADVLRNTSTIDVDIIDWDEDVGIVDSDEFLNSNRDKLIVYGRGGVWYIANKPISLHDACILVKEDLEEFIEEYIESVGLNLDNHQFDDVFNYVEFNISSDNSFKELAIERIRQFK